MLPMAKRHAAGMPVLDAASRAEIRAAYAAAGLPVTDAPEDEFVVGRAAWSRGVRPHPGAGVAGYTRA